MSADVRITAAQAETRETTADKLAQGVPPPGSKIGPASVPLSEDSLLAVDIRGLVEKGDMDEARQRFEGLVVVHQRRALRIAFQYLRDAAEADEAVQDAF